MDEILQDTTILRRGDISRANQVARERKERRGMEEAVTCALVWAASSCFKMLLWPAYRSTDFAVHAHWLALTQSQPPAKWYFDVASRWTLDYPPLFAWFEFVLGRFMFPPYEMIARINGEEEAADCWRNSSQGTNCFSPKSIIWHRGSVAVTELVVLGLAVYLFAKTWPDTATSESPRTTSKVMAIVLLCAFDPNLLVLDHVHFQYNGYLMGILIMSLACLRSDRPVLGAILFAVLLAHKHIFLYAAPLFFVYLLSSFCLSYRIHWMILKVALLGAAVLGILVPSLFSVCAPPLVRTDLETFVGCTKQVGVRLFPVQERGLVHAYWAPNFWALYAATDKVLKFALVKAWGVQFNSSGNGISSTEGLVQGEIAFDVLPRIPTVVTAILSILGMLPALFRVWRCRQPQLLIHAYCCCVMSCIFFGYHVHEKALLMVSLPLALCALDSAFDARCYLTLTWITQVALSPLLFPIELSSFKFLLLTSHILFSFTLLDTFHTNRKREIRMKNSGLISMGLGFVDAAYFIGLLAVFCFYELGPFIERFFVPESRRILQRYPFLALMFVSSYCAIGVAKEWFNLYSLLARKQQAIESYGNSPHIKPQKSPPIISFD